MVFVDGREEWKEGLHPLQIFFNVTDFLVGLHDYNPWYF